MRQITSALGLAALLLFAGCNKPWWRQPSANPPPKVVGPETVDAATLVSSLNANAQRLQSLQVDDLDIQAHADNQEVGLVGVMSCQKPRNFRLMANCFGSQAVDMGSNTQEFWWWISKADPPYLVHCAYQDLARGNVYLPFPFQPDWVVEALGLGEYNPTGNYQVKMNPQTVELIEQTTSLQGQPVRKVTVFDRATAGTAWPKVTAHVLQDSAGTEICSARIVDYRADKATGAVVPHQVVLSWPAQKIRLDMKLDGVKVNALTEQRAAALFSRPQLRNVRDIDLAHLPAQPTGQVQRVRGAMPEGRR
jgi:hypothetical protein